MSASFRREWSSDEVMRGLPRFLTSDVGVVLERGSSDEVMRGLPRFLTSDVSVVLERVVF